MVKKLSFLLVLVFAICVSSCSKEGVEVEYQYYPDADYAMMSQTLDLPAYPLDYTVTFPNYYTRPSTEFDNDLATLGRVLFYDINLSEDMTVSCASCHKQNLAFADDVAFSKGVNGNETDRNSLALGAVFNFREYYGSRTGGRVPFFWDNRVPTVEEQSEQTFKNANEMNMEMHQVLDRVVEQDYYTPLFKAAFPNENDLMTENNVLAAISEFVNSISSVHSEYDTGLSNYYAANNNLNNIGTVDFPNFSGLQNKGKTLYIQNCASCHGEINGAPNRVFANNGLDLTTTDPGQGGITDIGSEMSTFKVPTLRNITLTAPYMHDGRFLTLEEVLNHYSENIATHPNLSPELRSGDDAIQYNFSDEDKAALLAFFETFVDDKLLSDTKFADPFK